MSLHLGDFAEDATVDFKWSTQSAAGASITRATNGTVSVYIGNGTTQLTAGVTDTEDFDSVTGIHHCRIDLSADAAYATGSECQVVLSGATIDGESVNAVLAHFSIERTGGVLALLKGANGVAAIKTDTAAIKAKTDNLPSDPADQSLVIAATDAVMARLGAPAGASVSADIAAVKGDSAAILADTGTDGVVVAAGSKTGYRLSATGVDDVLDEAVEGSTTLRESVRLHNAVLGGKASGLETTTAVYRDLADSKDRVSATVDADGNRSAVTRDLT